MSTVVKVSICGKEYSLQTSETPTYLYGLARGLEKKISNITDTGASQFTASILVGLACLDDLNKSNERYDTLIEQSKKYVDEAGRSRLERDEVIKENENLKRQVEKLQIQLDELKKSEK